jgi:hypothetical protein
MSSSQDQDREQQLCSEVAPPPAANSNDIGKSSMEDKIDDDNVSETNAEALASIDRTPNDILCGRGQPFQVWEGNRTMHRLVNSYRDDYLNARRAEKPQIIKKIIQELRDGGSRFLRPHGDRWVEVDEESVYHKISHVMRLRKDNQSQIGSAKGKQASSSSGEARTAPDDEELDTKPAAASVSNLPFFRVMANAAGASSSAMDSNLFMGQQQVNDALLGPSSVDNADLAILQYAQQTVLLQSLLGNSNSSTGVLGTNLPNHNPLLNQLQHVDLQSLLQGLLQQPPSPQPSLHQLLSSQLQQELLLRQMAEHQQALYLGSMFHQPAPAQNNNPLSTAAVAAAFLQQAPQPDNQNHAAATAASALLQGSQSDQQNQSLIAALTREQLILQALGRQRELQPNSDRKQQQDKK